MVPFFRMLKRYYCYPGNTMMKLLLTLIHIFMWMKSFLNYFALKMILLNILQNFAIYLFCFTHHDDFSKWYISILQGKLKFLVLHNFMKCFLKIMFKKLLLDKGSSTSYVCTKIAKITPPPLFYAIIHIWLDPSLFIHTLYIFTPCPS